MAAQVHPWRRGRVLSAAQGRTLIALAEVAWGYFRTRKQFLLARLAARGWRVIYLEPMAAGRGNVWRPREADGVTVVTVPFLKPGTRQPAYNAATSFAPTRRALEEVGFVAAMAALRALGVGPVDVALVSNIYALRVLSGLRPGLVCYDFNDHPLQFSGVPAWSAAYLDQALSRADLFTTVSAHYVRLLSQRVAVPVVLVENGVEFDNFASPGRRPLPALERIPRPRVGYLGKVSHFLDFEVLGRMAAAEEFELVIVGPIPAETEASIRALARSTRVHVLGEVPYPDVPDALAGFDVGIIPFRAGDQYTVGINPNKLYQYWAAGLPVVSSPIEDVTPDPPQLEFANGPDAFLTSVRRTLASPRNPAAARERARGHDWDAIADRFADLLATALAAKASSGRVERAAIARFVAPGGRE